MRRLKSAFTLVELIVVITIVWVLSAIWFVSYTTYLSSARDTNRTVQLSDLHNGLRLYSVENRLPIPNNSVDISASGSLYAYQWNLSEDIIDTIWYQWGWIDPEYETYPVYMLSINKKDFQLMNFLEEDPVLAQKIIPASYANISDYSLLYPKTIGQPLGIILNANTQEPIHEEVNTSQAGVFDVVLSGSIVKAYYSDTKFLDSSMDNMLSLIPNQSCKRILEVWNSKGSDVYTINPTGNKNIRVYCDMETDGGWWTILVNNDNRDDESLIGDCKPRLSWFPDHSCWSIKESSDFSANAYNVGFSELVFAAYQWVFNNIVTYQYMKWDNTQTIPNTDTFESEEASFWDNELVWYEWKWNLRCDSYSPLYITLQNGSGPFEPHTTMQNSLGSAEAEFSFIDDGNSATMNTYGLDDYQDGDGCSDNWWPKEYRWYSAYIMVR